MTVFQERNPIIIIPAYCPDKRLINLIKEIREKVEFPIIVIDDGSGDNYLSIFLETKKFSNCLLYHNNINKGKGATLKNGVIYAIDKFPNNCGYVTCDADGQHSSDDIINVANTLIKNPLSLILGVRDFSINTVPTKSRIGNRISSLLLYFISGLKCSDTQTGLRGIPRSQERLFLSEPGDRYDFEMNFLINSAKRNIKILEVPIETIYIDNNKASHFRAIKDSVKIFGGILKYGVSSLLSFAIDISLFTVLNSIMFKVSSLNIILSTILARLTSGIFNFSLNQKWVFNSKNNNSNSAIKYTILFFSQMLASGFLVSFFNNFISNATICKLIIDTILFFVSYFIQKNIVFTKNKSHGVKRKVI